jgi:hypothetical protein
MVCSCYKDDETPGEEVQEEDRQEKVEKEGEGQDYSGCHSTIHFDDKPFCQLQAIIASRFNPECRRPKSNRCQVPEAVFGDPLLEVGVSVSIFQIRAGA